MSVERAKYPYKTQPYNHQVEALRRSWMRVAFAFLMEMGTGKTKVVIDEFCAMIFRCLITTVVVFAPKGVYRNWVDRELPTHMPDVVASGTMIVIWEPSGGSAENIRRLRAALTYAGPVILVVNTESMSSGNRADLYIRALMRRSGDSYMAVDESTFIKNADSNRTEKIVAVGRLATYRRIMTGSPVTKSPLDLFAQVQFLGDRLLGWDNYYTYRARYCVLKKTGMTVKRKDPKTGEVKESGRKVVKVVSYQHLDELSDRLERVSYRVTKEQCLDLPPKVYTIRDVDMTDEQLSRYVEMRDQAITILEHGGGDVTTASASVVITQMMRLHQICCGFVTDDDGVVRDIKNTRVSDLVDLAGETGEKIIIWSVYRHNIDQIVAALREGYGEGSVAEFHGGNVKTRSGEADRFCRSDACRFMVSSQRAGGFGNTWIEATQTVYFSNDYDLERRLQSEDRNHRSGQTKSVTYTDMRVRNSVEDKILQAHRMKIDIGTLIMRDGPRAWVI